MYTKFGDARKLWVNCAGSFIAVPVAHQQAPHQPISDGSVVQSTCIAVRCTCRSYIHEEMLVPKKGEENKEPHQVEGDRTQGEIEKKNASRERLQIMNTL